VRMEPTWDSRNAGGLMVLCKAAVEEGMMLPIVTWPVYVGA
jgi:hypothetical protein